MTADRLESRAPGDVLPIQIPDMGHHGRSMERTGTSVQLIEFTLDIDALQNVNFAVRYTGAHGRDCCTRTGRSISLVRLKDRHALHEAR
jgi:hypothetical protein